MHLHADRWQKAWDFLYSTDLSQLSTGKHLIDSNRVFALVTEGETRPIDDNRWEAHRHYADIHYVIAGKEKIGIAELKKEKPVVIYNPDKDIAFYHLKGKVFEADSNTYFIFFPPAEAHQPGVRLAGEPSSKIKKLVIKVSTDD